MDVVRNIDGTLGNINKFLLNQLSNSQIIKDEIKQTEKKYKL